MSNVIVFNLLLAATGGPLVVVTVWLIAHALVDPNPKQKQPTEPAPVTAPARRRELTR